MQISRLQWFTAHRKFVRRISFLLVCVAVTLLVVPDMSVTSVSAADSLETQKQQTEAEKKALEQKQKQLQNELAQTKSEMTQIQADKSKLNEQVTNINKQIYYVEEEIKTYREIIAKCEESIAEKQLEIENKQLEIDGKKSDYDTKYELFKERVRMTYEKSDVSYLEIVLNATSFTDLLSRIDRIGAMFEYDTKIMNELTDERVVLEAEHLSLQQAKTELEAELAENEAYKKELDSKNTELSSTQKKLNSKINEYTKNWNELNADKAADEKALAETQKKIEEADKEIENIAAEIARQAELAKSKYVGGDYMWPVPTSYNRVSSECGWRVSPITGKSEYHNGMDIPCTLNTNVYAANSGTVITATSHWSYGNYIMIDHGGGQVTLYAHNNSLCVKVGDKVTKGQVIAKAGTTGSSTGVHCHFSYYVNGTITNPRTILVQP